MRLPSILWPYVSPEDLKAVYYAPEERIPMEIGPDGYPRLKRPIIHLFKHTPLQHNLD